MSLGALLLVPRNSASLMMMLSTLLIPASFMKCTSTNAFTPNAIYHRNTITKDSNGISGIVPVTTSLYLDPAMVAAAAGLAGGAVGWGARAPEMSALQKSNEETKQKLEEVMQSLNNTQSDLANKRKSYEDALYEMDSEFEDGTSVLRKEFEEKLEVAKVEIKEEYNDKLEKVTTSLRQENGLKLVQQEGRLKQEFLQEKMEYTNEYNRRSADDVLKSLEKQSSLISENQELKESLQRLESDLKDIMKARKGFR